MLTFHNLAKPTLLRACEKAELAVGQDVIGCDVGLFFLAENLRDSSDPNVSISVTK